MNEKRGITIDDINKILILYPDGKLFWKDRDEGQFVSAGQMSASGKCRHWNKTRAGKEAFKSKLQSGKGMARGRLLGVDFMKSNVVFAISRGFWPTGPVIHLDDDIENFKPENLVEIDNSTKTAMSSKKGGRDTGFMGVYFDSSGGGRERRDGKEWCCYFNGKYIGNFDKPIDAAIAYDKAAIYKFGKRAKTNVLKVEGLQ